MVGIDIILLFGAVGLAIANPLGLEPRQSRASTTSPPWYPSRTFFFRSLLELFITGGITDAVGVVAKGGSSALWADSYAKAHDLVSKMTLLEKGRAGSAGWVAIGVANRVSYFRRS